MYPARVPTLAHRFPSRSTTQLRTPSEKERIFFLFLEERGGNKKKSHRGVLVLLPKRICRSGRGIRQSPDINRSKDPPPEARWVTAGTQLIQLLAPDSDRKGPLMIVPGNGAPEGRTRGEEGRSRRSGSVVARNSACKIPSSEIRREARKRRNSDEARERCTTQMVHQERGTHPVISFMHMRFALQGHAAQHH
jgi:hypothetical protein